MDSKILGFVLPLMFQSLFMVIVNVFERNCLTSPTVVTLARVDLGVRKRFVVN